MTNQIIENVRKELKTRENKEFASTQKRFFKEKESFKIYGIRTAEVSKISKLFYAELKQLPKNEVFDLCEVLWKSGYLEESFIACDWAFLICKKYEPEDFMIFEKWINNYVSNWASCDSLCNHAVGTLIEMYPDFVEELKKWTFSENRWIKRASAVSLIVSAKKGMFLNDVFKIA